MKTTITSDGLTVVREGLNIVSITPPLPYGVWSEESRALVGDRYATEEEAQIEVDRREALGEWVCLYTPPLPSFCECRCGCKSRASATFCGPCGRGCCGETAESLQAELEIDCDYCGKRPAVRFIPDMMPCASSGDWICESCDRPAPELEEDHLTRLEAIDRLFARAMGL